MDFISSLKLSFVGLVSRWHDPAKAILPKLLDNTLKGQDGVLRENAISAYESLTMTRPGEFMTHTMRNSSFSTFDSRMI